MTNLGPHTTVLGAAALVVIGAALSQVLAPETAGKSLTETAAGFTHRSGWVSPQRRIRRMVSCAALTPNAMAVQSRRRLHTLARRARQAQGITQLISTNLSWSSTDARQDTQNASWVSPAFTERWSTAAL